MAAALPYITVALSAAGAVEQMKAGNKADQIAKQNARLKEQEIAEEERRLKREQVRAEGTAKAKAAASGIGTGGSQGMFLSDIKNQHSKEIAWLRKSGKTQVSAIKQGGQNARSQAKSAALGTAASTSFSAYQAFGT